MEDSWCKFKVFFSILSIVEVIFVINSGQVLAVYFGEGEIWVEDIVGSLFGVIVKDLVQDCMAWEEYLEMVVKECKGWGDLYEASKGLLGKQYMMFNVFGFWVLYVFFECFFEIFV